MNNFIVRNIQFSLSKKIRRILFVNYHRTNFMRAQQRTLQFSLHDICRQEFDPTFFQEGNLSTFNDSKPTPLFLNLFLEPLLVPFL